MEIIIDDKVCLLKDLVISDGYRIIEDFELLELKRTDNKIKDLLLNNYVWCNTEHGVRAAALFYGNVYFLIVGSCILDYFGRSRGVFVKIKGEPNDM